MLISGRPPTLPVDGRSVTLLITVMIDHLGVILEKFLGVKRVLLGGFRQQFQRFDQSRFISSLSPHPTTLFSLFFSI